jgi:hypothetical protein
MARAFRRDRHGYSCWLEPEEAALIRQLAGDVAQLIASETGVAAGPGPVGPEPADGGDEGGRPVGGGASVEELERLVGLPGEPPRRPTDPVLWRLFPDAYADEGDAAEVRRFAQGDLVAGKLAALGTLRATIDDEGGRVSLDEDAAQSWLTGLNDLRLTLGTLAGVTEDDTDEVDEPSSDDPRADLLDVYHFLTFLQGTLVEAVAGM